MQEFKVKVQQTAEGRFYASTEVQPSKFILSWGYTIEEVKNCILQALVFSTGLVKSSILLVEL